ncbi:GntR family transcriptional regulator [Thermobifida cellulosilytica]|uniref:GntR family transcriptional regulator n=1 Tax=Thermobifida cellulosilytica TaxID=144786 RepID=UPI0009FBD356|nr:GntR family transcriptional regulator [Thermobifida cellulosilytica]
MDLPSGYGPDSELDMDGPDPRWAQLAAILVARIDAGWYKPGLPIPSLVQLVQEFGLARGTVRKAVEYLAEHGRLRVVQGKGAYVQPR